MKLRTLAGRIFRNASGIDAGGAVNHFGIMPAQPSWVRHLNRWYLKWWVQPIGLMLSGKSQRIRVA